MPSYTTLQRARRQMTVGSLEIVDDDLVTGFLSEAAQMIDDYTGNTFNETIATYGFNGQVGSRNTTLNLNERPLISIDSLINGDGTPIIASNYTILPIGSLYPKREVRLNQGNYWLSINSNSNGNCSANSPLPDEAYAEDAIQITGKWGFNRRGTAAWKLTGLTVGTLYTAGAATLALSGAPGLVFDVGSVLRIDSEYFLVSGPFTSSQQSGFTATTINVTGAYNGSTAANHNPTVPIYVYQTETVVDRATAMLVAWLYETRLAPSGGDTGAPGFGSTKVAAGMPAYVTGLLGYPYYNSWYGQ